jgi:hypothetical protein
MIPECLNHNDHMPDIDYLRQLAKKYNTNNFDELAKAEMKEVEESGIVGKFLDYKFKLKKN